MFFNDRTHAGQLLAEALDKYKNQEVVVFALPRGGVVVAAEIAKYLKAPLELIIVRKIGHPYQPEYAIAAIAEDGHMIGNPEELERVDPEWLEDAKTTQRQEAKRRREMYLQGRKEVSVNDKIAILVDDGIATGLTMQVGVMELRHLHPKKIVVATPVASQRCANLLKMQADELVALEVPEEHGFLGAVGAYYNEFSQVEDAEVIGILQNYAKEYANKKA